MTTRTTESTLNFQHAFALSALDAPLPAGAYRVDVDEEAIQGVSFLAFRRTQTLLHTPAVSNSDRSGRIPNQVFVVDGDELAAAFKADGLGAPSAKEL